MYDFIKFFFIYFFQGLMSASATPPLTPPLSLRETSPYPFIYKLNNPAMNNCCKMTYVFAVIFMLSSVYFVWFTPDTINPTFRTVEQYSEFDKAQCTYGIYVMLISGLLFIISSVRTMYCED